MSLFARESSAVSFCCVVSLGLLLALQRAEPVAAQPAAFPAFPSPNPPPAAPVEGPDPPATQRAPASAARAARPRRATRPAPATAARAVNPAPATAARAVNPAPAAPAITHAPAAAQPASKAAYLTAAPRRAPVAAAQPASKAVYSAAAPPGAPASAPPVSPQPAAAPLPPSAAEVAPPSASAALPLSYRPDPHDEAPLEAERSRKGETHCLAGSFCFGPVVTAGALNVFGIGAHARMAYWGIGIDYQFIGLTYDEVDGQLGLVTVEGRVYPFAGAFYLSAGLAWQSVALDTTVRIPEMNGIPAMDVHAEGGVTLPLFKLGVGLMGRDGFVLGIDLGLGIRLARMKVTLETDLPRIAQVIEAENEFKAAAQEWVDWLPFTLQLNVLRLGYLF